MMQHPGWRRSDIALAGIAGVTVLIFGITFFISPLNGEDFALTRQFGAFDLTERLPWVVDRSLQQITEFNARLGEQGAIFWLSMPKILFTLAAVTAFLALSLLLGNFFERGAQWPRNTVLAVASVLLLWPSLDVFFWGTGNAGYGQPMVLSIALLFAYATQGRRRKIADSRFVSPLLCVLGLLVGLSFENVPPAIAVFIAGALSTDRHARRRIRSWLPLVVTLAGWLVLVTAPSTVMRRQFYADRSGFSGYDLTYLQERIPSTLSAFFEFSAVLLALTAIAAVFLWVTAVHRKTLVLALATTLLVIASVVAAPYTEVRAFSVAWALMIAVCLAAVSEAMTRSRVVRVVTVTVLALGILMTLRVNAVYANFATLMDSRDAYIKRLAVTDQCQTGIEVEAIANAYPPRILNNRSQWFAQSPFKDSYYGCRIVVIKDSAATPAGAVPPNPR